MGDANHICTLGDYSKPSYEGCRNTIDLPVGNNVVPLRSDTIRLVQNGCSFHGLRSEDPNQHLKDFLKLVDSLELDGENRERMRLHLFQVSLRDQASNWLERKTAKLRNDIMMFQQHQGESLSECEIDRAAGGKFHDKNADESWEIIRNLALYDHEGWNDSKEFVKPVKAISTPQSTSKTPDRRLLELEDQINFLLKGASEKVLIREEAKSPVTKNVNSISLARGEEERNDNDDIAADSGINRIDTKMPLKESEKDTEVGNETKNKLIKELKEKEQRRHPTLSLIPEPICKVEKEIKNDIEPITSTMTVNRLVLEWEERIRLHQEIKMEFDQWRSKNFNNKHPALIKVDREMDDEGEVT
nr:MAK10-like protein [Tanacetum cinerariifolium]